MARIVIVYIAESFAMALKNANSNILVTVVSDKYIQENCQKPDVSTIWDNLQQLPGTTNFHRNGTVYWFCPCIFE